MKIIAVVQARMSSTRLPGKVMMRISSMPMVWHVVNRLHFSKKIDNIIVATSTNKADMVISKYMTAKNIHCYRGNLNDVLDRYYQISNIYDADYIVRVTGDCPLVDPALADKLITLAVQKKYDYVANSKYPYMDGFDIEVISRKALEQAWIASTLSSDREHVTPFIRRSKRFKKYLFQPPKKLANIHCSVDQMDDMRFVRLIFKKLREEGKKGDFSYNDVIGIFEQYPHVLEINKGHKINEGYKK